MDNKKKVLIALKKASTSLQKIIEKVEKNHYCIDVMQQNLAVIGLLRSAHENLMKNHLNTCFKNAVHSGDIKKQDEMIEEIIKVINFYNK